MRNSLMAIGSAVLLGGSLALGLPAAQENVPRAVDTPAETALSAASNAHVITPDTIDCTTFVSSNQCRTTIVIRASASAPDRDLTLKAVLASAGGNPVDVSVVTTCEDDCSKDVVKTGSKPARVVRVTLTLPPDWRRPWAPQVGSGLLGIASDKNANRFEGTPKRLRVLAPSPSYWQWLVILVPGVLAFAATVKVVGQLSPAISLDDRMGAPSWRASESWSSNVTVGAGLVNGVLALTVVSDFTVFMTKPSYAVVSMLLGAFVVLAPIVYGLSRRAVSSSEDQTDPVTPKNILIPVTTTFEGNVRTFLIAGALTLWASGGQLATFALLIGELWRFGVMSAPLAAIVELLVLAVFVALLKYGARTMLEAARHAKSAATPAQGARDGLRDEPGAPAWTLL